MKYVQTPEKLLETLDVKVDELEARIKVLESHAVHLTKLMDKDMNNMTKALKLIKELFNRPKRL